MTPFVWTLEAALAHLKEIVCEREDHEAIAFLEQHLQEQLDKIDELESELRHYAYP